MAGSKCTTTVRGVDTIYCSQHRQQHNRKTPNPTHNPTSPAASIAPEDTTTPSSNYQPQTLPTQEYAPIAAEEDLTPLQDTFNYNYIPQQHHVYDAVPGTNNSNHHHNEEEYEDDDDDDAQFMPKFPEMPSMPPIDLTNGINPARPTDLYYNALINQLREGVLSDEEKEALFFFQGIHNALADGVETAFPAIMKGYSKSIRENETLQIQMVRLAKKHSTYFKDIDPIISIAFCSYLTAEAIHFQNTNTSLSVRLYEKYKTNEISAELDKEQQQQEEEPETS